MQSANLLVLAMKMIFKYKPENSFQNYYAKFFKILELILRGSVQIFSQYIIN